MLTEKHIEYATPCERYWVLRDRKAYSVMVNGATHAKADSSYMLSGDGLSLAVARCNYLAKVKP